MRHSFFSLLARFAFGAFSVFSAASYAQPMQLEVDASNVAQRIFQVKQTIALANYAKNNQITLYFPKWIPGEHGPSGPLFNLAGLLLTVDGKAVPWKRDDLEPYAFVVDLPAGAKQLEAKFEHFSALSSANGRSDPVVVTPHLLGLVWNRLVLYPAGKPTAQIEVTASAVLPEGWQTAGALVPDSIRNNRVKFKTVSVETLIDSPVYAGRHTKREQLESGEHSVHLNIFADDAKSLVAKPEHIEAHKQLVTQSIKLFGSRHYKQYEFLLVLSDEFGRKGLEHHESSENAVASTYFTEWDKRWLGRDLLAHEFTHSWNGKFRRPIDLLRPDFHTPFRNELLWLYEGQTQYWGWVLAARSGLYSAEQARDSLAQTAAYLSVRTGRVWRNLQDTVNSGLIGGRGQGNAWGSYARGGDYYDEMLLNWLSADTLIRERSAGTRSLDDFAKLFFGVEDGRIAPLPYVFDDVVAALNQIEAQNWRTWLRERLDTNQVQAPLDGIERAGWRLTFGTEPSAAYSYWERDGELNLNYSLGLSLSKEGAITNVLWGGPAFKAGLANGVRLIAVNNLAYKADLLKAAITQAAADKKPLQLLLRRGDEYVTIGMNYTDGLRYPKLERIEGKPDLLTGILTAR
jgi:predicted metalloprotease with PDZ domain